MRYTVGNTYVFIHVDFKLDKPRFGSLYQPWRDKLIEIDLQEVTCIEHHRVPVAWAANIQYDGFIFKDAYDMLWRASYGQLDDSMDRKISRSSPTLEEYRALSAQDQERVMWFYTDVRTYLQNIIRGVEHGLVGMDSEIASLQVHFDEVVRMLNDLGYTVTRTPWMIKFTDGQAPEPAPSWMDRCVLTRTDKETDRAEPV